MKTMIVALAVAVSIAAAAPAAFAKDEPLQGKGAKLHQIVGNDPGTVEVVTSYDRAIKLVKLTKDEVAYWNPDGGKYIMAGDYAYVWCKVYNMKSSKSRFDWIALNSPDLTKALNLANETPSGVAFYKISSANGQMVLEAYSFDTVHAMSKGEAIVNVNE